MGAFTTVRNYAEAEPSGGKNYAPAPDDAADADPAPKPAVKPKPKPKPAAEKKTETKAQSFATVLGKIADYIPAEGIVAYLTVYALISGAKDGTPVQAAWGALGAAVVAVILFGAFSISTVKKVNRKKAILGAAVSLLLILLYASLLPENAFTLIPHWISWIPQLAAVIVNVALGLWGDRFIIPRGKE